MNRLLPSCLAAPLVLLGACQSRDAASLSPLSSAPRYASLDAAFDAQIGAQFGAAPGHRTGLHAVAVLPHWIGRPGRSRVTERPDGIAQAVTFETPGPAGGSSRLVAAWPDADATARGADAASDLPSKPTEAGIRDELAAVLPGVAMGVVTRPARNAYGPYGLAIGRGGDGLRCLYAWQWIEEPPPLGLAAAGRPLSLRLRLCRGDLTFDAMAAAFDRLRLVPAARGAPVAAPSRPHRPRARPVAARSAPVAAPDAAPDAGRAAAPDASGRRYLGAEAAPAPRPAGTALASAVAATPGPGSAATEPVGRTDLDLPPEALRGPSTDHARPRP